MRRARAIVLLSSCVGLVLGCAHTSKGGASKDPTASCVTMKLAEQLRTIGDHAQKKEWDAALAALDKIAAKKNVSPCERAVLWNMRAGLHFALNKTDEVIKDLEQGVALNALHEDEQLDAEYNLGQAYFTMERFSESADTFGKWAQRANNVDPSKDYVVASAYSQAKRFAEALPYATKAVDGSKEPKEPWLQLLLSLHYELKQDSEVAAVLQKLIAAFPKKEYWLQLCATYQALGQDAKALATLDEAYTKGLLDEERDLVNLARLYQQQGAPLKAAALLDKHMASGTIKKSPELLELLATCWIKGKDPDHARAVLQKGGADVGTGELYLALGRLEAQRGHWAEARDAASTALQRGGLANPGDAHLLLGIAHHKTKRKDVALASLGEAKKSPASAPCAEEWIKAIKGGAAAEPTCGMTASAPRAGRAAAAHH
ncbi:MAG: tetratricopeptide repeat protein [Polyangiales bacterium]